ncbi:MAG: porin family protein [Candidatus Acidiferrales bacterium]
MKRVIWIIPAILLLSFTARAQETPSWEISGGYSYLDANLNGSHFHLNGGSGSLTQNLNSWFGGRVEFTGVQGNEAITASGQTTVYSVNAQTITYGPVFSYRRFSRITPYGHVQIGAVHGSAEFLGISQSAYKFALAPGAGLDFALNRSTAIRVDGEYLLTRFLSLTQENANLSVGVVFRFGKRQSASH